MKVYQSLVTSRSDIAQVLAISENKEGARLHLKSDDTLNFDSPNECILRMVLCFFVRSELSEDELNDEATGCVSQLEDVESGEAIIFPIGRIPHEGFVDSLSFLGAEGSFSAPEARTVLSTLLTFSDEIEHA